jgi:REP element-mobilizing transposase RayT
MVIAYHLIWTLYGWWLPNDLRGSMSRGIASDVIADLGKLHHGRKRLQPASRDIRAFYNNAGAALKHPLLLLDAAATAIVGASFGETIQTFGYTCYACAIMPDHVHLLIRKHRHLAEEMIANLQRESQIALKEAGMREQEHPVWGGPGWKVFLDSPADIERTIPYVEDNPLKIYQPRQEWGFVTPYDGWEPPRVRVVR